MKTLADILAIAHNVGALMRAALIAAAVLGTAWLIIKATRRRKRHD